MPPALQPQKQEGAGQVTSSLLHILAARLTPAGERPGESPLGSPAGPAELAPRAVGRGAVPFAGQFGELSTPFDSLQIAGAPVDAVRAVLAKGRPVEQEQHDPVPHKDVCGCDPSAHVAKYGSEM